MVAFLSPGEDPQGVTWQINQSIIGFGSGGIFGVGFGEGTQKLGHLTYGYSDFIFSTIGEEWGLFGVTVIIVLYAVYVSLGMRIARRAGDAFGTLLAVGLTSLVGITAVLHMYVTLALAPTTGLPLPFISVGRSNLLMIMFATGIVMNIGNQSAVRTVR
jgi:cell division protein FtsW